MVAVKRSEALATAMALHRISGWLALTAKQGARLAIEGINGSRQRRPVNMATAAELQVVRQTDPEQIEQESP